jgi:hypothetical protein
MSTCKCNLSLGNTGQPNCEPVANATKKIIVVPYFDSLGNINSIDTTATLNKAFFDALTNQVDGSKRWFPLPQIKNVTDEKGDSVFETFEDATMSFIREGVRTFKGIMPKQTPTFLGKIKNYRCSEVGVFLVDKDGNLIGSSIVAGKMNPIRIDAATWNAVLVKGTDTTIQKIMLGFQFHLDELDENLNMILSSEIGISVISLTGLLDVYATATGISTTGFTAKLTTDYGSPITPIKVKGLIITDFALFNVSTSAAITITSVVENAGVYTFVFPAQASGNILRLTPTKAGFDFSNVVTTVIAVP